MTVYTVRNNTPQNQSFDDKTLVPQATVQVSFLTDDLLAAYHAGRVSITPRPEGNQHKVCIDPYQLPLPVRVYGSFNGLFVPGQIKDKPIVNVPDSAVQVAVADDSRISLRIRNTGLSPAALGGLGVTFSSAVHILEPGELFVENDAPNVLWCAVCDTGNSTTLTWLSVIT